MEYTKEQIKKCIADKDFELFKKILQKNTKPSEGNYLYVNLPTDEEYDDWFHEAEKYWDFRKSYISEYRTKTGKLKLVSGGAKRC